MLNRGFQMIQQNRLFDPHDGHSFAVAGPEATGAPAEEQKRLGGQNGLILSRLEKGAATNVELEEVSGSRRINSRVADIRRWLKANGRTIKSECVDAKSGVYRYEIINRA